MTYVQFTDSTQTAVLSVYACPQDPTAHPNQGQLDDTDLRLQAFLNPPAPPLSATAYQIRTALNQIQVNGSPLRAAVETAVAAASQQIKDAWQFQQTFTETDPMVQFIANAIQEQSEIHPVFALAVTLQP